MAKAIDFHLAAGSGVPAYAQVVRQVRQALRLGMLQPGDQLPTVREAVASLVINPNTVLKAYRELERDGLVDSRPGLGTFVVGSIAGPSAADQASLRAAFDRWLTEAEQAGLDRESIEALIAVALRRRSSARVA